MNIFDRFKKKTKTDEGVAPHATGVSFPQESQKEVKAAPSTVVAPVPAKAKKTVESKESKAKDPKAAEKRPKVLHKNSGAERILLSPVVTEKSAHLQAVNQYAFAVHPRAGKNEIAKAVEDAYGVKPIAVNVVSVASKFRRYGRHVGMTKRRKKAIVTLKKDDHLELFETTSS